VGSKCCTSPLSPHTLTQHQPNQTHHTNTLSPPPPSHSPQQVLNRTEFTEAMVLLAAERYTVHRIHNIEYSHTPFISHTSHLTNIHLTHYPPHTLSTSHTIHLAAIHSPHSIHLTPFTSLHSPHSIHLTPFTSLHSPHSIPLTPFPSLHSPHSIPLTPFPSLHSPHSIHLTPFPSMQVLCEERSV
jgi:hypothetical protein